MTRSLLATLVFVVSVGLLGNGCGAAVYHPGPTTAFEAHPAREITEDDIRVAFQARPQLPERVRVAYFSYDAARVDEIEAALHAIPRVEGTYRIPTVMVTGQRRYSEARPWDPPRDVGIHRLRLLAARARCDVLVVFDYGWRADRDANGYAALNVLLVPALFAPFLDVRVESYLDTYVIDTRNGYLYRHLSATQRGAEGRVNVWSSAERRLVEGQWGRLMGDTRRDLAAVFAEGRTAPPAPQPSQPP